VPDSRITRVARRVPDPPLERYRKLDDEVALEFKDALDKFVRTYSGL
jgi:hypothetical protein